MQGKEKIQVERWYQNGDCLADEHIKGTINEGKLVRRYRNPNLNGLSTCNKCGYYMHDHGFIEYKEQTVCPGDYIIKEDNDKYRAFPSAIEFTGENNKECLEFIRNNYDNTLNYPNVKTTKGIIRVNKKDWIAKDTDGKYYVYKCEIKIMKKYRKLPVIIDAGRWHWLCDLPGIVEQYTIDSENVCPYCGRYYENHGSIKTFDGAQIVCPGDWIIKDVDGNFYPCKPNIFRQTYEKINLS